MQLFLGREGVRTMFQIAAGTRSCPCVKAHCQLLNFWLAPWLSSLDFGIDSIHFHIGAPHVIHLK
jgi:hypothetical protein